jgi:hypothetical protein
VVSIFSDADLSVPIEVLPFFVFELSRCDAAIASHKAAGAKIEAHQPFFREMDKILSQKKGEPFSSPFSFLPAS